MLRAIFLTITLATLAVATFSARPAHAGWSTEPVEVRGTNALCPQITVCDDGAFGAIVVWAEAGYPTSPLLAVPLLADGEFDPAWPAMLTVVPSLAECTELRAFPDGAGGAILTWMEASSVRLLHLQADGTVSAATAPAGRVILTNVSAAAPPRIVSDGHGGLYAGRLVCVPCAYRVVHLTAEGGAAPGWSATGRAFTFTQDDQGNPAYFSCGSIAPAPDGGVLVVYAGFGVDPQGMTEPGAVRLTRLTSAGGVVPGWGGLRIASYPADEMPLVIPAGSQSWHLPRMSLVDVAADEAGGVWVVRGEAVAADQDLWPGQLRFIPKVHHLGADRVPVPGSPEAGLDVGMGMAWAFSDYGAEASFRVWARARGGFVVGRGDCANTGGPGFGARRFRADGGCEGGSGGGDLAGLEASAAGAGVVYVATFHPVGPMGPCDSDAYAQVSGSNGVGYFQMRPYEGSARFHDVGVAALPDGGAIFVWGQSGGRFGVYAVRLNAAGLVTGVPPSATPAPPRLALRFVPGQGVRASAAFASAGEAKLVLTDVLGRAVARESFAAGTAAREWTLANTEALAPGLYFARVTRGAETHGARVVVTR